MHSTTADTTEDVRVNAKLFKQATQPKELPLNRRGSKRLRDTIAACRGGNGARPGQHGAAVLVARQGHTVGTCKRGGCAAALAEGDRGGLGERLLLLAAS